MLAWRLFRNRLPTRDNLASCNVIQQDVAFCVIVCGEAESAKHLVLSCPVFAPLWNSIKSWIGISSADPDRLHDHFIQFTHSSGGLRARGSFLQLVWLCCISVNWNERNCRIFKAKEITVHHMVVKVKLYSLWWLKAYNVTLGLNIHKWWSSPLVCMGIDQNYCF
jgi:hypothetical protein